MEGDGAEAVERQAAPIAAGRQAAAAVTCELEDEGARLSPSPADRVGTEVAPVALDSACTCLRSAIAWRMSS